MFLQSEKDTLASLVNPKFVSPGPTFYHERSAFAPKNRIVTGSLMGPREIKEDVGFGLATRFQEPNNFTPGPSHYNTTSHSKEKVAAKPAVHTKLPKSIGVISCPSIPNARNRIGQTLQGRAVQPQPVDEDKGLAATVRAPPAYSFSKSEYPSRQPILLKQEDPQPHDTRQSTVNETNWITKPEHIEALKREDRQLQLMREENARRQRQLLDLVLSNNSIPSLEVLQMRKKFLNTEVPGPGFYHVNTNTIEVKNSDHMFTGFASNTDRFASKDEFPKQGPGRYTYQPKEKKPTAFSFGREKKQVAEPVRHEWTPHSESIGRNTESIIRQNSQPFGSGTRRFSSEPREKLNLEPSSRPLRTKMHSQVLRKLRKSISTNETMESEAGNLQSVDVLFHMYGNN